MKKQLLFEFTQSLFRKMSFRMAAFTVLTLLTAQSSFAQKWTFLSSGNDLTATTTTSSTRIAVAKVGSDFIPYALFTEGSGTASVIKVMKRSTSGTWIQAGGNLGGTGSSYGDIYADANGNVYVSYLDFTSVPANRMAVQKYNALLDAWQPLNNDPANLYVSDNSAMGATSTNVKGMTKGPIAFDSNNNPYIAFSQAGVAYVKKYDLATNTSWAQYGSNPTGSGTPTAKIFGAVSLLIDENNVPWIAGLMMTTLADTGATMDFFKYNAGAYDLVAGTTTNGIREAHMVLVKTGFNAGKIYIITYNTSVSSKAVVFNYDKNATTPSWGTSSTISTGATSYIRINSDTSGNLYASFRETVTINPPRIRKLLNSSGASWTDLADVSYTANAGIDAASSWQSIDVGQSPNPYIIYYQSSSTKPVVRLYVPLIATAPATAITNTGATLGGEVLAAAPTVGTIIERGVVYATTASPTTANTKVIEGTTTTGVFTSSITGLTDATTYYARAYIIYADATVAYGDNIIFTTPVTTWDGTAWSYAAPTATTAAIINGTYSTTTHGTITAKKLTVNAGKSLTINTGTNVTVQNQVINNGSLVVENNANLIQVLGTTNTNTGNIVVNRDSSPLLRLDYTLWSSPVASQNLAAFSPLTSQSPSRFYTYDTATSLYSNTFDPTATNFAAGKGYLIRMPNTADAGIPTAYAGQFTGVPNNGDVSIALSTAGSGYNLVGNPYPSTINLFTLQSNNSTIIGNTFYMWRTTNAAGTAYCTYVPSSTTTGTYVSNGNTQSPVSFVGNIQPGQGFFVSALTTGPLVFKNGQRLTTAGSFFKTKQLAAADKVWLNATNAAGDFSQMAVTYFDGATPGVDAFDGKYINDSPLALTSNINNEEYTIQGRPAFDASDVVPLNFKTAVAGDYTIAIDHSEGVFAAGQSVILTDATTGTETDLTTSTYTFTAATGTANSRFSLKYQKTLGTNKAVFSENSVTVYKNKGTLYVNSGNVAIANIKVYDVQGRLIAELKNVKSTSAIVSNLKATNQVLVVKITSQDNAVLNKKVIN